MSRIITANTQTLSAFDTEIVNGEFRAVFLTVKRLTVLPDITVARTSHQTLSCCIYLASHIDTRTHTDILISRREDYYYYYYYYYYLFCK